jgi:hypothetical protein
MSAIWVQSKNVAQRWQMLRDLPRSFALLRSDCSVELFIDNCAANGTLSLRPTDDLPGFRWSPSPRLRRTQ